MPGTQHTPAVVRGPAIGWLAQPQYVSLARTPSDAVNGGHGTSTTRVFTRVCLASALWFDFLYVGSGWICSPCEQLSRRATVIFHLVSASHFHIAEVCPFQPVATFLALSWDPQGSWFHTRSSNRFSGID